MPETAAPRSGFEGLLLDADNTLLDFDKAERAALLRTVGGRPGRARADALVASFHDINARLWRRFEAGGIDQGALRVERFRLLADAMRLEEQPALLAARYIDNLKLEAQLRPYALLALRRLRGRVGLVLLTNGLAEVQRARLARAGIETLFDAVLISEEVGLAKPDPRFFELGLRALGLPRQRVLCVGDSPGSDIRGGHAAGLATCWYAYPPMAYPAGEPPPDHRIDDLRRLLALVNLRR